MPNLTDRAKDIISDNIGDVFNGADLYENCNEAVFDMAESACTYYRDCEEIISRYESEVDDIVVDDLTSGKTYTASEWRQAMSAYAFGIAASVIRNELIELLDDVDEKAIAIADSAGDLGCEDTDSIRVTADCPHGWLAHDREDENGTLVWDNVEGCKAVAIKTAAGVWLSITWTPEANEE